MSAVAVIDIGKTNAKVLVYGPAGEHLFEASTANPVRRDGLYPHADVEALWTFIIASLKAAAVQAHPTSVVVTAHGATGALIDDDGLVLPVLDYEHDAVESIEPLYAPLRPAFADSLSPRMGNGLNLGRQVFWQQQTYPQEFAKAKHLLMYAQYWSWRLTGIAASEITSLGCHTDLWEPVAGKPSVLVETQGWRHLLPPMRAASEELGPITPAVAALTGLDPETPVLTGIHDSNASLLAHLTRETGAFTVVSSGTWVVILAAGTPTERLDPTADMLANVDALGRPVACAKFMGGRDYQTLLGEHPAEASEDDVAAVIAYGALALPSFSPLGGPYAGHKGTIAGVLPDRRGAMAALAALYMALMTDDLLCRLGVSEGPVIVDGNLARNRLYAGLLAALRQPQAVTLAADSAGTAFGAAMLDHFPNGRRAEVPAVARPFAPPGLAAYRARWREACRQLRP